MWKFHVVHGASTVCVPFLVSSLQEIMCC